MKTLIWILKTLIKIILPAVVIGLGVYAAMWLIANRPVPTRAPADIKPLSVEIIEAVKTRERITVREHGTVLPAQSISLRAEVGGRIIEQSPELVPGGRFKAGDVGFCASIRATTSTSSNSGNRMSKTPSSI